MSVKSDKELIEDAARACGYAWSEKVAKERERIGVVGLWLLPKDGSLGSTGWNPLESGGDAMGLAVTLGMKVHIDLEDGCTRILNEFDGVILRHMHHDGGAKKATYRAIVRAASVKWEAMQHER